MSPTYHCGTAASVWAFQSCLIQKKSASLKSDFPAVRLHLTFPDWELISRLGTYLWILGFLPKRTCHPSDAFAMIKPSWRRIFMNLETAWIYSGRKFREWEQNGHFSRSILEHVSPWFHLVRLQIHISWAGVFFETVLPLKPGESGFRALYNC